jgi:flagellar motor switch/type III secretory pathway protein FliN
LCASLRMVLHLDEAPDSLGPDAAAFKPWSGSVVAHLPLSAGVCVSVLLNASCAKSLQATQAGSVSPSSRRGAAAKPERIEIALAPRKVELRVELNACELELGALQDLRIGDVVPLPHLLEAPLQVRLTQGSSVCAGFLGKHAGFKAIELVREAPLASPLFSPKQ